MSTNQQRQLRYYHKAGKYAHVKTKQERTVIGGEGTVEEGASWLLDFPCFGRPPPPRRQGSVCGIVCVHSSYHDSGEGNNGHGFSPSAHYFLMPIPIIASRLIVHLPLGIDSSNLLSPLPAWSQYTSF